MGKEVSAGLGQHIHDYIEQAYEAAHPLLVEDREAVFYIPPYAIEALKNYLDVFKRFPIPNGNQLQYYGKDVVPGYENAVILVAPDYPLHKLDSMISKIKFQ